MIFSSKVILEVIKMKFFQRDRKRTNFLFPRIKKWRRNHHEAHLSREISWFSVKITKEHKRGERITRAEPKAHVVNFSPSLGLRLLVLIPTSLGDRSKYNCSFFHTFQPFLGGHNNSSQTLQKSGKNIKCQCRTWFWKLKAFSIEL